MAMSVGGGGEADDANFNAEINTTPLVDIMLVLLIIFLITVPVIQKMANVVIPKAVNIPTQTKPENITISVDKTGQIYWNAGLIQDKQVFFQRIVAEARKVPQPEFHIRPNKLVTYKYVAHVMAAAQRDGVTKMGLIGAEQFLD